MQATMGFVERAAFSLRRLYTGYGYTQYKMSKFEEYDLYAQNKDFLISDSVITFTDLDGKLMALKPDVTLSIVKNCPRRSGGVQRLFYNENVYRVAKGGHVFREIMQVGLECIGNVDDYCIAEVLFLAAKSLQTVSQEVVLDISHLGMLREAMDSVGIPKEKQGRVVQLLSEKNAHELRTLCLDCGVSDAVFSQLVQLKGTPSEVLPQLTELLKDYVNPETLNAFTNVLNVLESTPLAPMLRVDFSVVDDLHYYNGFVFKGFVNGLPDSVLSGGQYDKLMQKMKRSERAIGFAVYLDLLEQLEQPDTGYDVDIVLLYEAGTPMQAVWQKAQSLMAEGNRVMVLSTLDETVRYRTLMNMNGEEVVQP